ncbi:Uncharacterised protein [Chlamydia trachomatis]|nr:Uncharacterised protein [Chlamydia trachomatis]
MSSWEKQQASSCRSIESRVLLVDEVGEGELRAFPALPDCSRAPGLLRHVGRPAGQQGQGSGPEGEIWRRELDEKVLKYWHASDTTSGSPRVTIDLRDEGMYVERKTVAKRMVGSRSKGSAHVPGCCW